MQVHHCEEWTSTPLCTQQRLPDQRVHGMPAPHSMVPWEKCAERYDVGLHLIKDAITTLQLCQLASQRTRQVLLQE